METQKEKLNSFSFRWGGTSTDVKIYFDTADDLEKQIIDLSEKTINLKEKIAKIRTEMIE